MQWRTRSRATIAGSYCSRRAPWRNVFTGRTQDLDDVGVFVWSTPRVADDAVAKQLCAMGIDTRLIGDCMA
jgi:hypothetical protein